MVRGQRRFGGIVGPEVEVSPGPGTRSTPAPVAVLPARLRRKDEVSSDAFKWGCDTHQTLSIITLSTTVLMEQCALINVNNCLNANIYSYLETSGGKRFIYI